MDASLLTETRVCKGCFIEKPLSDFGVDRHLKTGRLGKCRSCTTAKSRMYYAQNPETYSEIKVRSRASSLRYFKKRTQGYKSFINALKQGRPCVGCAGLFAVECLEFDHVQDGKRYGIAQMSNHSRARVEEELHRCVLVCCNCHRVRTAFRQPSGTIRSPNLRKKLQDFRQWMAEKKAAPCADCAGTFPSVAMDFDHVRGTKTAGLSGMWSWPREKVVQELLKCDLVCANCHRMRTVRRLRKDAEV